jgi:hypothetical protein
MIVAFGTPEREVARMPQVTQRDQLKSVEVSRRSWPSADPGKVYRSEICDLIRSLGLTPPKSGPA